jgi:hypothetical protein
LSAQFSQQAMVGQVQARLGHAGQVRRCFSISQPQAAQLMPSISRVVSASSPGGGRSFAARRAVVQGQFVLQVAPAGLRGWRWCRCGAGNSFQATGDDRLGHRLAARAAELPGSPSTTAVKRLPAGTGRAQW